MSKQKPAKKKVVVSSKGSSSGKGPAKPRSRSGSKSSSATTKRPLTFGRDTYIWMGIGVLLIIIGMFLMSGGSMPDANTWDEDIIYSFRRTVLAPIFILAGLGIEIYAIFKK